MRGNFRFPRIHAPEDFVARELEEELHVVDELDDARGVRCEEFARGCEHAPRNEVVEDIGERGGAAGAGALVRLERCVGLRTSAPMSCRCRSSSS